MDFAQYNIEKSLVDALAKHGYKDMTSVQSVIIPLALKGDSLIVKAKTGSGKTHAFLIPILARLTKKKEMQAIIFAPTRELARQIYDFAVQLNNDYRQIDIMLLAGGLEKSRNKERLVNKPDLIIATPGRFNDLMTNENLISLKSVHTLVLDEGDMLLDSGFYEIIAKTLSLMNPQSISLYSATIPQKLLNLVTQYTGVKKIIDVDKDDKTSNNVTHYLIDVHHQNRYESAYNFIKFYNPYLLLVFASTNKEVMELYDFLGTKGIKCGLLTGELESRKRKAMLRRVKDNEFSVVVASDIAARGIDIDHISHVLSISFPYDLEYYFHRAGRTGRFESSGDAYTFFDHDDLQTVAKVESLGVKFTYLLLRDDQITAGKERSLTKKSLTPTQKELEIKIQKTVATHKTTEIKPGYKRRVKEAVKKVKKAHRRAVIKKSIKDQRAKRTRGGSDEE